MFYLMRSPFWAQLLAAHYCAFGRLFSWKVLYTISAGFALLAQPLSAASLEEANRLFESGNHQAAETMYRELIEGTTNVSVRGMATFNLGKVLQSLNRYDEAVTAFTNLLGQPVNDL